MAGDIKTKDKNVSSVSSAGVRTIDRMKVLKDKAKETTVRTREGIRRFESDSDNETTYAEDRTTEIARDAGNDTIQTAKRGADKAKNKAKQKVQESIEKKLEKRLDASESVEANDHYDHHPGSYNADTNIHFNSNTDYEVAVERSNKGKTISDQSGRLKRDYTSDNSNSRGRYTSQNNKAPDQKVLQKDKVDGNNISYKGNEPKIKPERTVKTPERHVRTGRQTVQSSAETSTKATGQAAKGSIKTAERSVKTAQHTFRSAETTGRVTIKTSETAAQTVQKGAEATAKAGKSAAVAAKNTGTVAARAASTIGKAVSSAVKAVGSAAKEGFSAIGGLIAGSGPMIILIFVLAAVAVLCTGDAAHRPNSDIDTQTIIQEINESWIEQIDELTEPYDEANTTGTRASWQEIMALYAAKSSASSVDNWEQEHELKTIFWEMHSLSYKVELVIEPERIPEMPTKITMKEADCEFYYFADGTLYKQETVTYQNEKDITEILKEYEGREYKQVINIEIHHKSMDEMMDKYDFTDWQREQAEMLVGEEFDEFWLNKVYNLNTSVVSSSSQKAIIESCMSTPAAKAGYCATWVSNVYANAGIGGIGGNADDMWAAYCYTSDRSKLQPGMIIAVNSTGYSGDGYLYGHVGIYVGDNTVMHSTGGAVVTNTLDDWIAIYDTYGTVRWGFPDGVSVGNDTIVSVALSQIGNTGGQPYWSYCGYSSRVEWCACFVSWCAEQCGYVSSGQFIKTASPPAQASFFKNAGQWMDGSGTPNPGMVIFFDWNNVEFADHCGIVEKVENGYVYTIEGNSKDAVRRGTWKIGDEQIMGYGWIAD